jgi:hypothetical protein
MDRRILIIFVSFIMLSFSQCTKKRSADFSYIDFTYSETWFNLYSINIDSTGRYLIKTNFEPDRERYYCGQLSDPKFNKIVLLADSIKKVKLDSIYFENYNGEDLSYIIIKYYNKKVVVGLHGISNTILDSIRMIFSEMAHSKNLVPKDTSYKFESRNCFKPPPEMKHVVNFVPPDTTSSN